MKPENLSMKLDRRTVLKTAVAAGALQIASPFIITARAADTVKIGLDNPLTGTYAALGKNELIGANSPSNRSMPRAASSVARSSSWSRTSPAATPAPRCKRRAS